VANSEWILGTHPEIKEVCNLGPAWAQVQGGGEEAAIKLAKIIRNWGNTLLSRLPILKS